MMCQQPPWGELTRSNVHTGEIAWRVPLGVTDSLPPEKQKTGRPGNGGSIATAGGLVFVGATDDARFRAFDAKSGNGAVGVQAGRRRAGDAEHVPRPRWQAVRGDSATGGGALEAPTADDSVMAFALPAAK